MTVSCCSKPESLRDLGGLVERESADEAVAEPDPEPDSLRDFCGLVEQESADEALAEPQPQADLNSQWFQADGVLESLRDLQDLVDRLGSLASLASVASSRGDACFERPPVFMFSERRDEHFSRLRNGMETVSEFRKAPRNGFEEFCETQKRFLSFAQLLE